MKIRVADFIIDKLYKAGTHHAFLITGGMIMHLTDALLQYKKQKFTCCHHEQAAVMAADAYGRYTGKLGVAYVTSGPGALNTLTGVVGAYADRAPCIIVAGQAKVSQAIVTGPRQFPIQSFNTLPIFSQVTKYSVMLTDVSKVKYEIEKCIYLATCFPAGPVWIECPLDIQGTMFDPDKYVGFKPEAKVLDAATLVEQCELTKKALQNSIRPVFLLGAGIRSSGAVETINNLISSVNIPVLTSRLGMDLIVDNNHLFVGRPGIYGTRAANFAIQNSDLIIAIGCRLSIGLIGHDYQNFAPQAKKIVVDIDEEELKKPSIKPDIAIKADAKDFIDILQRKLLGYRFQNQKWVDQTQRWRRQYPLDLPIYLKEKDGINSYHFITRFSEKTSAGDIFLLDAGSCFFVYGQAFKVKPNQRHITSGGLSTMGFMPASMGVAVAAGGRSVYCVTGDGSLQMNIQELETIAHNKLPIKLIVFNNGGYLLIRQSQINLMKGRLIGESSKTGVGFPDLKKIAIAYGIKYMRISKLSELECKLKVLINSKSPLICEVLTPRYQQLMPRVASKKTKDGGMISMPYDDMFPFLPRKEYRKNKIS